MRLHTLFLRHEGLPFIFKKIVGGKLDSGSILCEFVGYPRASIGYCIYDPKEQNIYFKDYRLLEEDVSIG